MSYQIKEPILTEDKKMLYEARFSSLLDVYDYLNSKPKINSEIYKNRSSQSSETSFHGVPLEKAISYLKSGYTEGFDDFLKLKKEIDRKISPPTETYTMETGKVGGRVHVPSALGGSSNFMIKPVYYEEHKYVDINYQIAFKAGTSRGEIKNRGIAALSLITLLEKHGINVNLNAFSLSETNREYSLLLFQLKKYGGLIDMYGAYYAFTSKEFLRRICFYIEETLAVKDNYWGDTYGRPVSEEDAKKILGTSGNSIYFGTADELGITDDLKESIINSYERIGLTDYIDIDIKKL